MSDELGVRPQDVVAFGYRTDTVPLATPIEDTSLTFDAFIDSASAAFQRENTALTAWRNASRGGMFDDMDNEVGNPMDLMESHLGREWMNQNLEDIDAGYYDDVFTLHDLGQRATEIAEEKALVAEMDRSFTGALVGSLATAIVDPLTYVPVGGVMIKGARLARMFKMAVSGAMSAAAQESALQAMQRTRSLEESFLNVTGAALIGGTLGGLIGRSKVDPIAPTGKPIETRAEVPGESELGPVPINTSVGAAESGFRVTTDDVSLEGGVVTRGLSKTQAALMRSPIHRAFHMENKEAAGLLFKLMGTGGVVTKAIRAGRSAIMSADDLRNFHMTPVNSLFGIMDNAVGKLVKDMDIKFHRFDQKQRVYNDVFDLARRIIRQIDTEKAMGQLTQKYGAENAAKIMSTAQGVGKAVKATNDAFRENMKKQGLLRDQKVTDNLEMEIARLKSEKKMAKEAAKADPEAPKVDVSTFNDQIAELEKRLAKEQEKPADLGDDYGIAQMWDTNWIDLNRDQARVFLRDVMLKTPDEEWLDEFYEMTPAEFEAIRGTAQADEILESWAGDAQDHLMAKAKARLESAERAAENSSNEYNYNLRLLGLLKKDQQDLSVKKAKAKTAAYQAKLNALARNRDELREVQQGLSKAQQADDRAFKDAATAARTMTLERQLQGDIAPGPEAGAKAFSRLQQLKDAEGKVTPKLEEANRAADADTYGIPNAAEADPKVLQKAIQLEKRLETLLAQQQKLLDELNEGVSPPEALGPEMTPKLARAEERALASADEAGRVEKTIEGRIAFAEKQRLAAQKKLDDANSKLRRYELDAERLKEQRKLFKQAEMDAKTARSKARSELKAAERGVRKANSMIPLDQYVERTLDKIAQGQRLDSNDATDLSPLSGRLKQRTLLLTPEQRARAEEMGMLQTDMRAILQKQYDELAGDLAMHEALDVGVGRSYESVREVFESIQKDYNVRIEEATSEARKKALRSEREQALSDFKMMRERLLRRDSLDPKHPWLAWFSAKIRQLNLMRYGMGFGLSSLTDTATVVFNNPIRHAVKSFGPVLSNMRGAPRGELMAIVHGTELGMHDLSSPSRGVLARLGEDDLYNTMNPISDKDSAMGKVFGGIDRAMQYGSTLSTTAGGMHHWNRFLKSYSVVALQYRLDDFVKRGWDNLSATEQVEMSSLGIGKEDFSRISEEVRTHRTESGDGYVELNSDQWSPEARRVMNLAAIRHVNRSVTTPGIGDTPLVMSNSVGKMFLQFWSHPYAFTNRFIFAAMQRGAMGDPRVAYAMGMLATSATIVAAAKMAIKGEDPLEVFEKEPDRFVMDVMTRGGLFGTYDQMINSIAQLAGVGATSKYQQRNPVTTALGMGVSTMSDIVSAGDAAVSASFGHGEWDLAGEKASRLLPAQVLGDLYDVFTD